MEDSKVEEVVYFYESYLFQSCSFSDKIKHLHYMLSEIRSFIAEGKRDKAMRWLGFIQGVFWVDNIFSIEDLKSHNRTS